MSTTKQEALDYHSSGRRGKIEVVSTKPCFTSRDLSLAYSPGVAEPCREIEKNPEDVYRYTAKGNLVAVISNGTAVLGLGDIGAAAGKPVMEGKGVLFKRFADIDVFDIEIDSKDVDEIVQTVKLLEPTFGGINLEDIKAPQCFEIEKRLKESMDIPVFHDDQHGTAIISCAALINAVELAGKKMDEIKVVVSGAGASAFSCSKLYMRVGVKQENIFMFDSRGLIHKDRDNLNVYKQEFAQEKYFASLADAMVGADVFIGLSVAGLVTQDMVKSMAPNAIVFAMANPDPEITYEDATAVRKDIIMATGRSDYPNQVNNVLGFPFIFRGALDVRARAINEDMKLAATKALAELAKEDIPDAVIRAYGGRDFSFGPDYIIPKPFDQRVLWKVAPAVAKAAIDTGVAGKIITDWDAYEEELKQRLGLSQEFMRILTQKAKKKPKRVVYPEGSQEKIIRAAHFVKSEGMGTPILLGNKKEIQDKIDQIGFTSDNLEIIDPKKSKKREVYAQAYYDKRQRKGTQLNDARDKMGSPDYFGSMMVDQGDADCLISGLNYHYPQTVRPALQCVGKRDDLRVVSGLYAIIIKRQVYFFADATINVDPDPQTLADIAIMTADRVKDFDIEPKVAMLSFSNFGSVNDPKTRKVKEAVAIVKERRPDLIVDGEMQADVAVVPDLMEKEFPFCQIKGGANVLVFPDLNSGNITYKLIERLTDATVIGPILVGLKKPIHVLQMGASTDEIINMTAIGIVDATINNKNS